MPLQNRMDPEGMPHAVSARGTLMGNRGGRIHDPDRRVLLDPHWETHRWASRRWITCRLDFKDRQRSVWQTGYTEFFFLDEVTALAAGHRPCFECRRAHANLYVDALRSDPQWRDLPAGIDALDKALHGQRLRSARPRATDPDTLPSGTVLRDGRRFIARWKGDWFAFGFEGWRPCAAPSPNATVQTPALSVSALASGYRPNFVRAG